MAHYFLLKRLTFLFALWLSFFIDKGIPSARVMKFEFSVKKWESQEKMQTAKPKREQPIKTILIELKLSVSLVSQSANSVLVCCLQKENALQMRHCSEHNCNEPGPHFRRRFFALLNFFSIFLSQTAYALVIEKYSLVEETHFYNSKEKL